ncbi:MAG TPA: hypothetical protein VGG69_07955 [Rhizomicrobium sp.]
MTEVSIVRLYVLRAMFALIGVAQGYLQFPLFFHHPHWTLAGGVVHSMLATLSALSLVGIFYPLRMLPVLVYELLWKSIWLLGIALPLWLSNQFDPDTRDTFYECVGVVILIPIIPWRYFFRGRPDPWRLTPVRSPNPAPAE